MNTMTVSQLHKRLEHLMVLAPDACVVLEIPTGDYAVMARLDHLDISVSPSEVDAGQVTLTAEVQG